MATVTGLTAERMIEMENQTVIDGNIVGNDLILVTRDATPINAGNVRGPQGPSGAAHIICTSTTRPTLTAGEEGKSIYETDTDLIRVWTGTRWRVQEYIICTSTTRPAGLVAADEGTKIYETDSNLEFIWTGTSWWLAGTNPPGLVSATLALTADPGWTMADGTAYSRTGDGARLFGKIGTTWGVGNGTTTFTKPDLRGRVIVGQGSGGISGALGAVGGEIQHLLTGPESGIQAHFHFYKYGGALAAGWPASGPSVIGHDNVAIDSTSLMGPTNAQNAHNNLQPYMLLGVQISL